MKINPLHSTPVLKIMKQSIPKLDFADWIQETMHTPSQHCGNDEYYRLHQQQLQQSSLQFNTPVYENHVSDSDTTQSVTHFEEPTSKSKFSPQHYIKFTLLDKLVHHNEQHKIRFDKVMERIQFTFSKVPSVSVTYLNKSIDNKKESEAKTPLLNNWGDLSSNIDYKNNHLFINNNQAELTLNLNSLSQRERKIVVKLIKLFFEQQAYILKKLVINGVSHDQCN